jgi:hypothetical protein
MRVTQGTVVSLTGKFRDQDTGDPTDPPDVVMMYLPPGGVLTNATFSGGQITKISKGVYRGFINTSAAAGIWAWVFGSIGPSAVLDQDVFTVDPLPG